MTTRDEPGAFYLDHNAASPLLPAAAQAMEAAREAGGFNPASSHAAGRAARRVLESARDRIAELLSVDARRGARIVFVSGATEGANLAILGLAAKRPGPIVTSGLEHASVLGPLSRLAASGREVLVAPVLPSGDVDATRFVELISEETAFACCTAANGETGAVVGISPIAKACRAASVPLVADASQAAGKIPMSFKDLDAAALVVSSHKLGGPRGVGALCLAPRVEIEPQLLGGMQQAGVRPGTECPVLATGFAASLSWWVDSGEPLRRSLQHARDLFENRILETEADAVVHAAGRIRLPQTSCIQFRGLDGQRLQIALDSAGVACSLGSACASGSPEPSPSLLAMGVSPESAMQSLRFSFGPGDDDSSAATAAARILQSSKHLRDRVAGR